jgi:hypothetical protein
MLISKRCQKLLKLMLIKLTLIDRVCRCIIKNNIEVKNI